ncbi:metal-sulfur cluster assembly factor [Pseudonocardia sp.]|uniref:metal-sulfur cluster assembly factor n=1 Tax=Pseudonocardia sp. TaxID=60912 RepID=UPI003D09CA86
MTARTADRVREALTEVLDPDLGINVVDMGFVRDIRIDVRSDGDNARLTMTLTSPACPLTKIMEDQIRTALVGSGLVARYAIDWEFSPPWHPSDITPEGREQLVAIGFTP